MSAHAPKDLLVRVNETLDDFEANSLQLLHLANEFQDMAERNLALVNRIRTRTAKLDDPGDEMVLPNAIKPRGKELSEGAVAKLENDIKAALGDEPNVVRSEAA